jgi:hypothetical protein
VAPGLGPGVDPPGRFGGVAARHHIQQSSAAAADIHDRGCFESGCAPLADVGAESRVRVRWSGAGRQREAATGALCSPQRVEGFTPELRWYFDERTNPDSFLWGISANQVSTRRQRHKPTDPAHIPAPALTARRRCTERPMLNIRPEKPEHRQRMVQSEPVVDLQALTQRLPPPATMHHYLLRGLDVRG